MMMSFVTVIHRSAQRGAVLLLAVLAAGCSDSRGDFIGARVRDECDAAWPVCNRVAGCILGTESYAEGRFPGRGQFIVQVKEASTLKVSFYLEEVASAGDELVVLFHEEGCRARTREAATGRAALDSMDKFGVFTREANVTGVGDHLIEFEADMQARYLVKVDVSPLRNQ
jgi:hypothetical protein